MRLLSLLVALTLAACSRALPEPTRADHPVDAFVVVPHPPPPARPEFVPRPPSDTAVWIDGEWRWRRGRWAWLHGRWVEPPDGAAGFARWAWRRDALGRLHYAPGTWRDADGRALRHPRPARLANADEGDVIEDTGRLMDVGPNVITRRPRRWRGPSPSPCDDEPDVDDERAPALREQPAGDRPPEGGRPPARGEGPRRGPANRAPDVE